MRELHRITESRTSDMWRKILAALKKEASSKNMKVDNVTLNGFDVVEKRNPENSCHFDLELMNTNAGEVIVSANGRQWKMGDTFIRDRRSSASGGMKRPDMDSQVKNIMDMAQSMIEKRKNKKAESINRKKCIESSGHDDVLRGAVTNLGKYNEGKLDYVWVSFPCDKDDFDKYLKKIGISDEPNEDGVVYDEWFFTDWDTDYDWVSTDGLGEYESLDDINEFAEALESIVDDDKEEEFKAAMEYTGDDFRRSLELVENDEVIKISDESLSNKRDEEIGYYFVDAIGGDVSEVSHPENYFDYEAFGRDIRLEYYQADEEDPETAGEYWCGDEDASDEEIGEAAVDDLGWEGVGKDNIERYFDYEAYGRDIRLEGSFVQNDDGIFEITD